MHDLRSIDFEFWLALIAITVPILANAWWISLKLLTQLKIIALELAGNKTDHEKLRSDSREIKNDLKANCAAVNAKLGETDNTVGKHGERIAHLEAQCD